MIVEYGIEKESLQFKDLIDGEIYLIEDFIYKGAIVIKSHNCVVSLEKGSHWTEPPFFFKRVSSGHSVTLTQE